MAPAGRSDGPGGENPLVRTFFEKRENLVLFLAARTRDMSTAEDLVQDLYLKIAAQPPEEVKSPSALLYRMAGNLLIDHVRSRQRASRREGQWRMDVRVKWKKYETVKESSHFLMGACYMTAGGEYDIYAGGDFYTQCKGSQYVQQKGDHHSEAGGD